MANGLYDKGREKFLRGETSWNDGTIDAILVKIGTGVGEYDVNLATNEFLEDVPVAARVALLSGNTVNAAALGTKTTTAGVADAADALFDEVTGDACGAIVLYERKVTDTETTSPLIAYIDTATGLPVTPTGVDIEVKWDDGANKIFKL